MKLCSTFHAQLSRGWWKAGALPLAGFNTRSPAWGKGGLEDRLYSWRGRHGKYILGTPGSQSHLLHLSQSYFSSTARGLWVEGEHYTFIIQCFSSQNISQSSAGHYVTSHHYLLFPYDYLNTIKNVTPRFSNCWWSVCNISMIKNCTLAVLHTKHMPLDCKDCFSFQYTCSIWLQAGALKSTKTLQNGSVAPKICLIIDVSSYKFLHSDWLMIQKHFRHVPSVF